MRFILAGLLTLVAFFDSSVVWSRGGDEILNGGGIAEQNFTLAWLRMPSMIELCAKVSCAQNSDERALLRNLGALEAPFPPLLFLSRAANPGPFQTPGWSRVIAGSGNIGSSLSVDTDQLYNDGQPMSLAAAARELILALLGRDSASSSRTAADDLASHLASLVNQRVQSKDLNSIGQKEVRSLVWDFSPFPSEISIADSGSEFDLTALVQTNLICPSGVEAESGFRLRNLVWAEMPSWDSVGLSQPAELVGEISYSCGPSQIQARIDMIPRFRPVDGQGKFVLHKAWSATPNVHLIYIDGSTQVSLVDVSILNP